MVKKIDLLQFVQRGGCASKIPAKNLADLLSDLNFGTHPNLLVGNETNDDASVWKINDDVAIIQTTDFFPPLCSDPYEFGQIAVANALSDVYAMGGTPITALNLVMFPATTVDLVYLKEILKGGADKAAEGGVILTGGHSIDDEVPKYGLAVTGIVHPQKIIRNDRVKNGQLLILTKPLGTGQIMAAYKSKKASVDIYQNAIESMKLLNKTAMEVMQIYDIEAATDVTGFGLIGHAMEMARGSRMKLVIENKKVPFLEGACEIARQDFSPCSIRKNSDYVENDVCFESSVYGEYRKLLLDPQTSGGILMAVPEDKAQNVLIDLKERGLKSSCVIGQALSHHESDPLIIVK